jgi:uncharacterized membrane protein
VAASPDELSPAATSVLPADANTTCPVLPDEPVDPEIFVEYAGKRVWLCCDRCRREFVADPAKYIPMLPQFAGARMGGGAPDVAGVRDAGETSPLGSSVAKEPGPAADSGSRRPIGSGIWKKSLQFLGRLHPVAVHFPIALILFAAMIEAFQFVVRREVAWRVAVPPMLALGAASAVVAAGFGWLNASFSRHPGMEQFVELHRWLGTAGAVLAVLALALCHVGRKGAAPVWRRLYFVAVFVAVALIGAASHFGGALVYGLDYFFR